MKNLYKSILLTILSISMSQLFAASPNWTIDREDYQNTMAITARVFLNSEFTSNSLDSIAVFVDGECRGVAGTQYVATLDAYYFFLLASSNVSAGETLSFKVYSQDTDAVIDLNNTLEFITDANQGDIDLPYILQNSIDGAEILSFVFDGISTETVINYDSNLVFVEVPSNTVLTSLVATYELSTGATAFIDSIEQLNGYSVNDFTYSINYNIQSATGLISNDWKIIVNGVRDTLAIALAINELQNIEFSVFPNPTKSYLNIQSSELMNDFNCSILSLDGRLIKSTLLHSYQPILNVSSLKKGFYYLHVQSDDKNGIIKFLKN